MDTEKLYQDYRKAGQSLAEFARDQGINKGSLSRVFQSYEAGLQAGMRKQQITTKKEEPEPGFISILWSWVVYFYKKIRKRKRR